MRLRYVVRRFWVGIVVGLIMALVPVMAVSADITSTVGSYGSLFTSIISAIEPQLPILVGAVLVIVGGILFAKVGWRTVRGWLGRS